MCTLALVESERIVSRISELLVRPWLRVIVLRLDVLDLVAYVPCGGEVRVPLTWGVATAREIEALFDAWPDSAEEHARHYEVYHQLGFETWLLFRHAETGEPAHLQVLVTHDDLDRVKRSMPRALYGMVADEGCAHRGWVYTFEKFRKMGVSLAATDCMVEYCRERGIHKVYGHRGLVNEVSLRMADRSGFVPVAHLYQFQIGRQRRHEGFYWRRPA